MRIVSLEGLPYEATQHVAGELAYLNERNGQLIGVDAQGIVRAKGDLSLSDKSQRIQGVFPAPKGDVYVVTQELEPRTDFERFEPNQKIAVTRLSADLKKRWRFTKTLSNVSDLYGCGVGVDKNGSITVAVGIPQKAFRLKDNGKLDWEADLPIKNAVQGLYIDGSGTTHIAMTPTLFEGDGEEIHKISMVDISPSGVASSLKKLGSKFAEMKGRRQVGRYLYINLQALNDVRVTCVDLETDEVKWQRSLGPSVVNTDLLVAGNDKGEGAFQYRLGSKFMLSGVDANGSSLFDSERKEGISTLRYTSKGLTALYTRETEGVVETRIDMINRYGKITEAYGIAGTGGTPQIAEVNGAFLISNVNVQQTMETSNGRNVRAMPILWLLLPNKKS